MRRKREAVLPCEWNNDRLPKTVRQYREKYKGISRLLDENPEILDRVHGDLKKLSQGGRGGRDADFTSETILRALVVHAIEGLSLRETVIRIAGSDFLQDFLRTRKKAVMDFTFLDKCLLAIRPQTWRRVNELLGNKAVAGEQVDPSVIRTDTTVVESNIHWPTDSSLLWDTWRVASRLLKRGRSLCPASCQHRFHDRKIKRLHLFATRYYTSTSKKRRRAVQRAMRTLIQRAGWIVEIAGEFCRLGGQSVDIELQAVTEQLIARHKKLFGEVPDVLAADKGFCPAAEEYAELQAQVATLAIPRRMRDLADAVMATWRAFRAGIEGTISGLKRAFRLSRCFYRGFKGFASATGLGVFCHNLVVLAEQGAT